MAHSLAVHGHALRLHGGKLIILKRNPETLRERARFTSSEGTKAWDRFLIPLVAIAGPMATMIVAGLDHRWGWSPPIPQGSQNLDGLIVAAGYALGVWAMIENPFFSAVARIQRDRGQEVVTAGPYQFVRHPAYLGAILASLALPLMLAALWSLIPAMVMVVGFAMLTALGDQMLRDDLMGYEAYADKTRFRLIPAVW